MLTAKDEVRRMLEALPDDATWEDVQHSIYVRERIERGRREAEDGKVLSQEEAERRMKRWIDE
jgi:predicted transcriptional regulator